MIKHFFFIFKLKTGSRDFFFFQPGYNSSLFFFVTNLQLRRPPNLMSRVSSPTVVAFATGGPFQWMYASWPGNIFK